MAVSNITIINKMIQELTAAKAVQHNEQQLKQHIASVRLLCDLLLEEQAENELDKSNVVSTEDISELEWKAMLGGSAKPKVHKKTDRIDHDDANGDSIFDF